ncbi:hypothetical protein ONS95_009613 [Cadophora gregata]|uniref:uncharacterized protein n=1 Tax=Cadophora gregata TaxID=51156 RepID=UPI0026DD10A1|nr:uncharacterized protein ONS95_009613 [Cadophora gregata]KAK0124667.1 hypothetical protein ONS95_009613 [Cadophora gregata]
MSTPTPTLLLIGSGPGLGISIAKSFATHSFSKIALISRNNTRLLSEKASLESSVLESAGKQIEVETRSVDIAESEKFKTVLKEVGEWGTVTCVVFNAARVQPSEILVEGEEEIVKEFMITNIALYTAAQWAMPILSKLPVEQKPSFLVTSSLLWKHPYPPFFSLSMVKASQRTLVQCLGLAFPDVHCALLNVAGQVSEDDKVFNPTAISEKFWELYDQEKDAWTLDLDVLAPQ